QRALRRLGLGLERALERVGIGAVEARFGLALRRGRLLAPLRFGVAVLGGAGLGLRVLARDEIARAARGALGDLGEPLLFDRGARGLRQRRRLVNGGRDLGRAAGLAHDDRALREVGPQRRDLGEDLGV